MQASEFAQWLRKARAAFPGVDKFLTGDLSDDRAHLWREALRAVPGDVALQAVESMVDGSARKPEFGRWEDLPSLVLEFAKEDANARLAREFDDRRNNPRISCSLCGDVTAAVVTVWNPRFLDECRMNLAFCQTAVEVNDLYRSWRRNHGRGAGGLSTTVLCICDGAAKKREVLNEWRGGKSKRNPACRDIYSERIHDLWITGLPADLDDAIDVEFETEPQLQIEEQQDAHSSTVPTVSKRLFDTH